MRLETGCLLSLFVCILIAVPGCAKYTVKVQNPQEQMELMVTSEIDHHLLEKMTDPVWYFDQDSKCVFGERQEGTSKDLEGICAQNVLKTQAGYAKELANTFDVNPGEEPNYGMDPRWADPKYLAKRLKAKSLNIFSTLYHRLPSLMLSFHHPDPRMFFTESIKFVSNLPSNLGILEFYTNPNYRVKSAIDLTESEKIFEQIIIVNTQVLNLRISEPKEIISAIRDQVPSQVDLIELGRVFSPGVVQTMSQIRIDRIGNYEDISTLTLKFNNVNSHQDLKEVDKFIETLIPADGENPSRFFVELNQLAHNEAECSKSVRIDSIHNVSTSFERFLEADCSSFEDKIQEESDVSQGIFRRITDEPRTHAISVTLEYLGYSFFIDNINLQKKTDQAKTFYYVLRTTKDLDGDTNKAKQIRDFAFDIYFRFVQKNSYKHFPAHDEELGNLFSSQKSGPPNGKLYRKDIIDTLTFEEFMEHFIQPLKSSENTMQLQLNSEGQEITLFLNPASSEMIKAFRLILQNYDYIKSVRIIFYKFGKQEHSSVTYVDYLVADIAANSTNEYAMEVRYDTHLPLKPPILRTSDSFDLTYVKEEDGEVTYEASGFWKQIQPKVLDTLGIIDRLKLSKITVGSCEYDSLSDTQADLIFTRLNVCLNRQIENLKDNSNSELHPYKSSKYQQKLVLQKHHVESYRVHDPSFVMLHVSGNAVYCVENPDSSSIEDLLYCFDIMKPESSMLVQHGLIKYPQSYECGVSFEDFSTLEPPDETVQHYFVTIDILIMLYGQRYENFFVKSIDSMVNNQELDGTSQKLRVWLPRNHLTEKFRKEIVDRWTCNDDFTKAQVCVDIRFVSYKWFKGLFDHYRTIAEELQLARIMLMPYLIPSYVKNLIIKDADQIMQRGNIMDFVKDLSYEDIQEAPPLIE